MDETRPSPVAPRTKPPMTKTREDQPGAPARSREEEDARTSGLRDAQAPSITGIAIAGSPNVRDPSITGIAIPELQFRDVRIAPSITGIAIAGSPNVQAPSITGIAIAGRPGRTPRLPASPELQLEVQTPDRTARLPASPELQLPEVHCRTSELPQHHRNCNPGSRIALRLPASPELQLPDVQTHRLTA